MDYYLKIDIDYASTIKIMTTNLRVSLLWLNIKLLIFTYHGNAAY